MKHVSDKKQPKKHGKKINLFETFTKLWVTVLLIFALIDLQFSYVLAFLGMDQIAESLSVAIVTEIIGVAGIYMIRAFFDTFSEKKHEHAMSLEKKEYSSEEDESDIPNIDEDNNECG